MINAKKQAKKIAKLEAEVAALKAAQPTPFDEAAVARHRDQLHQASEARMSRDSAFTRDQLAAFQAACPDSVAQDIVRDNRAPTGPSSAGIIPSSQQLTSVHPGGGAPPISGTGWLSERKFGDDGRHPTPSVGYADKIVDEFDRRDRVDLEKRLGKP